MVYGTYSGFDVRRHTINLEPATDPTCEGLLCAPAASSEFPTLRGLEGAGVAEMEEEGAGPMSCWVAQRTVAFR